MTIHSEQLDLVPMAPAFLKASLEGDRTAAENLLEASIPPDWPAIPDILAMRLRELENDPALEPWLLRSMVLRSDRIMIGHIGFHTAPGADYLEPFSPGAVEFGFEVFPAFQRLGYAREASRAMMAWAHRIYSIQSFILSIRPDNIPSQRLAAQLGFTRIGAHLDEVDGVEDILERRISSAA